MFRQLFLMTALLATAPVIANAAASNRGVISAGGSLAAEVIPNAKFTYQCVIAIHETNDCYYRKALTITDADFESGIFNFWAKPDTETWDHTQSCDNSFLNEQVNFSFGFLPTPLSETQGIYELSLGVSVQIKDQLPVAIYDGTGGGVSIQSGAYANASLFYYIDGKPTSADASLYCDQVSWENLPAQP